MKKFVHLRWKERVEQEMNSNTEQADEITHANITNQNSDTDLLLKEQESVVEIKKYSPRQLLKKRSAIRKFSRGKDMRLQALRQSCGRTEKSNDRSESSWSENNKSIFARPKLTYVDLMIRAFDDAKVTEMSAEKIASLICKRFPYFYTLKYLRACLAQAMLKSNCFERSGARGHWRFTSKKKRNRNQGQLSKRKRKCNNKSEDEEEIYDCLPHCSSSRPGRRQRKRPDFFRPEWTPIRRSRRKKLSAAPDNSDHTEPVLVPLPESLENFISRCDSTKSDVMSGTGIPIDIPKIKIEPGFNDIIQSDDGDDIKYKAKGNEEKSIANTVENLKVEEAFKDEPQLHTKLQVSESRQKIIEKNRKTLEEAISKVISQNEECLKNIPQYKPLVQPKPPSTLRDIRRFRRPTAFQIFTPVQFPPSSISYSNFPVSCNKSTLTNSYKFHQYHQDSSTKSISKSNPDISYIARKSNDSDMDRNNRKNVYLNTMNSYPYFPHCMINKHVKNGKRIYPKLKNTELGCNIQRKKRSPKVYFKSPRDTRSQISPPLTLPFDDDISPTLTPPEYKTGILQKRRFYDCINTEEKPLSYSCPPLHTTGNLSSKEKNFNKAFGKLENTSLDSERALNDQSKLKHTQGLVNDSAKQDRNEKQTYTLSQSILNGTNNVLSTTISDPVNCLDLNDENMVDSAFAEYAQRNSELDDIVALIDPMMTTTSSRPVSKENSPQLVEKGMRTCLRKNEYTSESDDDNRYSGLFFNAHSSDHGNRNLHESANEASDANGSKDKLDDDRECIIVDDDSTSPGKQDSQDHLVRNEPDVFKSPVTPKIHSIFSIPRSQWTESPQSTNTKMNAAEITSPQFSKLRHLLQPDQINLIKENLKKFEFTASANIKCCKRSNARKRKTSRVSETQNLKGSPTNIIHNANQSNGSSGQIYRYIPPYQWNYDMSSNSRLFYSPHYLTYPSQISSMNHCRVDFSNQFNQVYENDCKNPTSGIPVKREYSSPTENQQYRIHGSHVYRYGGSTQ